MRLATWNVNSVRSRIDRLESWLARVEPDVIALQETKCGPRDFPTARLERLGYAVAHRGTGGFNGVAIASRVGLDDVSTELPGAPSWEGRVEARAVGATCGGVRVWSFYAPNGRRLTHPHMAYKLAWLAAVRDAAAGWTVAEPDLPVALCGDWNVAPQDEDVWNPQFWSTRTHCSPPERAAFRAVLDAGYADLVRPHAPGPGVYTFWEYLHERFAKGQGMRIDFVLGSVALARRVEGAVVDVGERAGASSSDHAPVVVQVAD